MQSMLRLHHKTQHLIAALVLGTARWGVADLLRDEREGLGEIIRAVKSGLDVRLHAYALFHAPGSGEARYLSLSKAHHLIHFSPASDGQRACCWPQRTTQVFESVFLSREHMTNCMEAHETAAPDLLASWRAKKWAELLRSRLRTAHRSGLLLQASKALLQLGFVEGGYKPCLPGTARLMRSAAAKLHALSQLNRTIQGVVECTRAEENNAKCNHKALSRMFHEYRDPILEFFAADSCCNFGALRSTVQHAFFAALTDLRQQGVLTQDARGVLETIDDYMRCAEISVAAQIVENDQHLLRALASSQ
mmetsp:Transcript_23193/g.46421  ORF Transcript_23193/g.46421 Transcript_23193/m.46421 type:complete len:306 (-) Transcript_23193:165-1082(-)